MEQENADPDADGAKPLQVSEEDWNKLTPAEQAAKLGSSVRQLARQGLLDPQSWRCNACSRSNVPLSTICQKCSTPQQDAFGGYILPSQDREGFEKLTSYYSQLDADAKKRRNQNKLAKRAVLAQTRASNDDAWECHTCKAQGLEARMSLTTEYCFRCHQKRPIKNQGYCFPND